MSGWETKPSFHWLKKICPASVLDIQGEAVRCLFGGFLTFVDFFDSAEVEPFSFFLT